MKKIPLALLLSTLPTSLIAAEAMIIGQGKVLAEPDYVELRMHVSSKCYNTPELAAKANDEVTQKIVEFLNDHLEGEGYYNKVISEGGFTQPYQSYQRNRVYCENTFQKNTQITFRTQEIKDFAELFNKIQNKVLKQYSLTPKNIIEAQITHVTLNQPDARISHIKQNELEKAAFKLALTNAKEKLNALFDSKIDDVTIVNVSELPPKAPSPAPYARSRNQTLQAHQAEAAVAPVQFDSEWVNQTLYFTFNFQEDS